jgi:hypothetical protein
MDETIKITLFLDKRSSGIIEPNGTYGTRNYSDWFITIPLVKTQVLDDYMKTYKDTNTSFIPRQLINPYFINYGFFETIQSYSSGTSTNENISTKAPLYNITINS